ncbi:sialate O-acetylesterase [Microbulbifer harenosus]|uniref:Sialate O-acetylesterase n=1 Tax=Microbulbifer harenosus TaxID=2576840 RepID=A0ABY2UGH8_9GAMM|nr:sialate O-acetylesterase [Microbulbifer harenosus]TLM75237.1 sialate O-acetylesterase [Microbulbifer harenosus]
MARMFAATNIKLQARIALFLLLTGTVWSAHAEIIPARIFSDHMVLQRGQDVPIWGSAAPNTSISLRFGSYIYSDRSDDSGNWKISVPPQKAGGPYTLTLSGDGETVIHDVYFGDVWLAGGQSNMEWKLSWEINDSDKIIDAANFPLIRFFDVPSEISPTPKKDLSGGTWKKTTPENAAEFSAVAYLFALKNHTEKNVAVGIIDNNWGGTPAEAWMSKAALLALPDYRARTQALYQPDIDWPAQFALNDRNAAEKMHRLSSREDALESGAHRFEFATTGWSAQTLPQEFEHIAWLRREFTIDKVPETAILELGDLQQEAFVWINEQLISVEDWRSQNAHYTIPAELLKKGRNLIALRVGNSWHNKPYVGRADQLWLQLGERKLDLSGGWRYSNHVEPPIPEHIRYEHKPTFLYNSMIYPIRSYGLRGVIWYQGEANVAEAPLYHDLFSALIRDWRNQWQRDIPFLFVQLAAFMQPQNPQPDSSWALLRDMQSRTLSLPGTGMATAIDIGDATDIHPRNKQDVAARLWGEAKRVSFGEDVLSRGPTYISHRLNGNKAIIKFAHIGDGLQVSEGDNVKGFVLADSAGKYHRAEAKISGDTVIVWNDDVKKPTALKYAWADYPEVNLYNSASLPALPFAIDAL